MGHVVLDEFILFLYRLFSWANLFQQQQKPTTKTDVHLYEINTIFVVNKNDFKFVIRLLTSW